MSKAEKYFQESKDMSVKDAFEAGAYYTPYDMTSFAEQYHKTQTVKDMPSDEEIKKYSCDVSSDTRFRDVFELGAKWLKLKIRKK